MASVTLFNAERMQAIEDGTVTTGLVDVDGNLILTHHDGSTVNAGNVVGPVGPPVDLPDRLDVGQYITNWNDATDPGFYYSSGATNSPPPVDAYPFASSHAGVVYYHSSGIIQEVHELRAGVTPVIYSRYYDGTTWTSWSNGYVTGNVPISDCNVVIKPGMYAPVESALNLPSDISSTTAAVLEIATRSATSIRQRIYRNGIDSQIQNLVLNPSAETGDTSNWLAGSANTTIAYSSVKAYIGLGSIAATSIASGVGAVYCGTATPYVAIKPETQYYGLIHVTSPVAGATGAANIRFFDSSGATINTVTGTSIAIPTAGWTTIDVSAIAPANAVKATIYFSYATAATGQIMYLDAVLLMAGTGIDPATNLPQEYFDGSFTSTSVFIYSWIGPTNASASLRRANDADFDTREWERLSTDGGTTWTRWTLHSHGKIRFKGGSNGVAWTASVNVPWVVLEDSNSAWNTSTKVWTAPYTGLYLISYQIKGTVSTSQAFNIMKNGNLFRLTPNMPATNDGAGASFIEYLQSGDTLAMQPRVAGWTTTAEPNGAYSNWFETLLID